MATTLPAPTVGITSADPMAGAAGISGDPGALYAAADEMTATAKAYSNAADAIAAHGRAVTANWVGNASDAAGRHIATLSTRVQVGSEVYTAAATAIRTYASELAAAQDAWNTASTRASTAATALTQAHQQASTAAAIPTTDATGKPDPTAQSAQSQAAHDAATAARTANTALSGAQQDMATAAADAAAANQHAADAITTCCDQLTAMSGKASTPTTITRAGPGATGTSAHAAPPQHHQSAWDGAIDWAKGAENWLEDNSGTIADVLGTAALISAFIPGVDLAVTPILGALSASAGLMAAHHAYADGDKAEGDQQILMAGLSILPDGRILGEGLLAGKALKEADDVADAAHEATTTEAVASAPGAKPLTGPVHVIPPPNATPKEVEDTRLYAQKAQEALEAGALSETGRVSTTGDLRLAASAAAAKERAAAERRGAPYQGHAGHVPDTTWSGNAEPHTWIDLEPRVNKSLGGQARRYPLGYKPSEFVFKAREGD